MVFASVSVGVWVPKRLGTSLLVDSMVTGGFAHVLIAMMGCNSSQYLQILARAAR